LKKLGILTIAGIVSVPAMAQFAGGAKVLDEGVTAGKKALKTITNPKAAVDAAKEILNQEKAVTNLTNDLATSGKTFSKVENNASEDLAKKALKELEVTDKAATKADVDAVIDASDMGTEFKAALDNANKELKAARGDQKKIQYALNKKAKLADIQKETQAEIKRINAQIEEAMAKTDIDSDALNALNRKVEAVNALADLQARSTDALGNTFISPSFCKDFSAEIIENVVNMGNRALDDVVAEMKTFDQTGVAYGDAYRESRLRNLAEEYKVEGLGKSADQTLEENKRTISKLDTDCNMRG